MIEYIESTKLLKLIMIFKKVSIEVKITYVDDYAANLIHPTNINQLPNIYR